MIVKCSVCSKIEYRVNLLGMDELKKVVRVMHLETFLPTIFWLGIEVFLRQRPDRLKSLGIAVGVELFLRFPVAVSEEGVTVFLLQQLKVQASRLISDIALEFLEGG